MYSAIINCRMRVVDLLTYLIFCFLILHIFHQKFSNNSLTKTFSGNSCKILKNFFKYMNFHIPDLCISELSWVKHFKSTSYFTHDFQQILFEFSRNSCNEIIAWHFFIYYPIKVSRNFSIKWNVKKRSRVLFHAIWKNLVPIRILCTIKDYSKYFLFLF